jgi:serine/threonine protein kinase
MEYADGGNLRQFMSSYLSRWKHRRMHGWPLFVRTIEEYAALHDEGLLLLDAKPENVLIVNGQPKVSDIGLAVCRNGSWKGIFEVEVPPSSRGTPEYMSPEQAMARTAQTLGPQSDVYSLASMGYELLHARCERPFKLNPEYLVDGLPPYRKISGISEALNEVFARGLNADPKRRQRDARALLTDLRQCDEARAALPATPDGFMRTSSDTHLDIVSRRNCGSRTKSSRDDGRKRTVGGPSNSQTESRQVAVRREEADRICRLLLTDNPSWDLAAMGDFVRQVERLYPEHPELELARVKLDIREQRYRKEVSRGWQALQEMDVELSRRHFSRALELNTGDDRIQRVLQAVNLLLDRLIASFQGVEDGRRSGNESMMSAPSRNGYDDDLDTLAEDVVAFVGELLGMERDGHG